MRRVLTVEYLYGYTLRIVFDDGVEGELDISKLVRFHRVFAPLKDIVFFKRVRVPKGSKTIVWPGEIDIAPDTLYEEITGIVPEWANDVLPAKKRPRQSEPVG